MPDSVCVFFFSSRRRHTRYIGDWSSDVCSSDLIAGEFEADPKSSAELRRSIGTGQSLNGPLRGDLERGFGKSLSGVKLHTDGNASRSEERRVGKECRARWTRDC